MNLLQPGIKTTEFLKPGIKTTEFWLALAPGIVAGLVAMGLVPLSDQQHLTAVIASAVWAAYSGVDYSQGRRVLKTPPPPVVIQPVRESPTKDGSDDSQSGDTTAQRNP